MLRSEAVSRIQRGLGFRSDRAAEVISALQEEQRDLEKGKTLPKFLLVEDATLSLLQGANSVSLPADYLRRSDHLIRYTPIYSTYPRRIPWRDYDSAVLSYQSYNPGGPHVASLRETTIYFSPEADRDYTLTWSYYGKATALTSDVENSWLDDDNVPELLIGGAGLRIAEDMRNEEAIKLFTKMKLQARAALFGEIVVDEAHDVMVMGADN